MNGEQLGEPLPYGTGRRDKATLSGQGGSDGIPHLAVLLIGNFGKWPLDQILFSFCNGELYKISVTYRHQGLRAAGHSNGSVALSLLIR